MLQRNCQGSQAITPCCLSTWAPMILSGKIRGIKGDYKVLRARIKNYRLASLTASPATIMGQDPLEHISGPMQEKEVIRKSKYGFTKGQSYLNGLCCGHPQLLGHLFCGEALFLLLLGTSCPVWCKAILLRWRPHTINNLGMVRYTVDLDLDKTGFKSRKKGKEIHRKHTEIQI